jgi:hypothetical protein
LGTAYDNPIRTGKSTSAVFNLVCTMTGGGMLSLPYAMAAGGIVMGPIFLLISAIGSDFSIYILVSAARRTGAQTYEEVAMFAFGKNARTVRYDPPAHAPNPLHPPNLPTSQPPNLPTSQPPNLPTSQPPPAVANTSPSPSHAHALPRPFRR